LPIDKPPARGREAAVLRFTLAFAFAARGDAARATSVQAVDTPLNTAHEYGP